MSKKLAHITEIEGGRVEQSLTDHALNVANYAADKLKSVRLFHMAYLAGLLHDMGKGSARYQDYLERVTRGEKVARGSVNHTFCGCIYLLKNYHAGKPQGFDTMTCEILVYAIGAHHGQIRLSRPTTPAALNTGSTKAPRKSAMTRRWRIS